VNFGTPVPLLVGIILILMAVGLFFLDKFKPGYKRDSDTVYSILILVVGILCFADLGLNLLVSLQLMVFAGMLIALMVENIRRRTPGNTPLYSSGGGGGGRNPDRPSRSYRAGFEENPRSEVRAEFDDDPLPMEEPSRVRRIRGGREGSSSRDAYQNAYRDQLSEDTREPRRTPSRRSSNSYDDEPQYGEEQRSRRRSPLQIEGDAVAAAPDNSSGYSEERSEWIEPPSPNVRRRGRGNASSSSDEPELSSASRSSRRRSRSNGDRPDNGDYVDYKPLSSPKPPSNDDDFDNSSNFDDNPSFR
jgi:hypothetical protein